MANDAPDVRRLLARCVSKRVRTGPEVVRDPGERATELRRLSFTPSVSQLQAAIRAARSILDLS